MDFIDIHKTLCILTFLYFNIKKHITMVFLSFLILAKNMFFMFMLSASSKNHDCNIKTGLKKLFILLLLLGFN